MPISVEIGRESDGDMIGRLFCHISHKGSTGTKYYLSSLDQIGDTVRDYVKEYFEDDGADICYRVR